MFAVVFCRYSSFQLESRRGKGPKSEMRDEKSGVSVIQVVANTCKSEVANLGLRRSGIVQLESCFE